MRHATRASSRDEVRSPVPVDVAGPHPDATSEGGIVGVLLRPRGPERLFLRDPTEEVRLAPGEIYTVRPGRAHLVTHGGETSATFLLLQGIGDCRDHRSAGTAYSVGRTRRRRC